MTLAAYAPVDRDDALYGSTIMTTIVLSHVAWEPPFRIPTTVDLPLSLNHVIVVFWGRLEERSVTDCNCARKKVNQETLVLIDLIFWVGGLIG